MTLTILYSYNKRGVEAEWWHRELTAASNDRYRFVPFNHQHYLPVTYLRAQILDDLYHDRHPGLLRMYDEVRQVAAREHASAILVDNAMPYHPDWLRTFPIYKVLRTSDGPLTAYDRDFAYVHAYDHVLYHSPAYSPELDMREKLYYVGAKRADFWPFAVWDALFDTSLSEDETFARERDVDVVFVGFPYRNKLPVFAKVLKALGNRVVMHGFNAKFNLYFNARYGWPGWVRKPIRPGQDFIDLYHRSKIGFNVHNRGDYTVGSYRMFELPANGVMQISDGGRHLDAFFEEGKEIIGYRDVDDMIDKIRYYLDHDAEREQIARNGYRRVMRDHRFAHRMQQAGRLIEEGMSQ